jgi:hypothetical protein
VPDPAGILESRECRNGLRQAGPNFARPGSGSLVAASRSHKSGRMYRCVRRRHGFCGVDHRAIDGRVVATMITEAQKPRRSATDDFDRQRRTVPDDHFRFARDGPMNYIRAHWGC